MKAETRKQLETNELKEQLGRLWQPGKKPPSVLWLFLVLGVVVGVGYWWISSRAADRNAEAWTRFFKSRAVMDAIGGELKGTPAELAVLLDEADAKFEDGFGRLFSNPELALEEMKIASTTYEELSKRTDGHPDLQVRALSGAGKASEAMGDLTRALYFYHAAKKLGEQRGWHQHPLVVDAANRVSRLEGDTASGRAFYTDWPARLPKAQPLGPPPAPPEAPPLVPLPTFPADATPAPTTPVMPPLPDALKPVPTGSLLPTQPEPPTPTETTPAPPAPPAPTATAPTPTTPAPTPPPPPPPPAR